MEQNGYEHTAIIQFNQRSGTLTGISAHRTCIQKVHLPLLADLSKSLDFRITIEMINTEQAAVFNETI